MLQNITCIYYLLSFLSRVINTLSMPISTFFLLSRGISLEQIGIYFSIFYFTYLISDVPFGILADRYGQKKTYIAGLFLYSVSCLMFIYLSNAYFLYLIGIISGLSSSAISGILQAWYVNEYQIDGNKEVKLKTFSYLQAILNNGASVGIFLSLALYYFYGYTIIYIIQAISFFVLTIISYYAISENCFNNLQEQNDNNFSKEYFLKRIKFLTNFKFLRILIFSAILGFVWAGFGVVWLPILKEVFNPDSTLIFYEIIVYGFIYLISGIALFFLTKPISKLLKNIYHQLLLLRIIFAISFILMGLFWDSKLSFLFGTEYKIPIVFIILAILMFVSGDIEYGPLTYIQNQLFTEENRSFGLSIFSTGDTILSIFGSYIISIIYIKYGILAFFLLCGGLLLISSLLLLRLNNEKHNPE